MRTLLSILVALAVAATSAGAQQANLALGVATAQRGGVTIVCRHGITDRVDEDEMTLSYDDPSTQRRLSAEGERQAIAIGKAFRRLRIPVTEVIASPMQRARRTGELAFGAVRLDSTWHTRGNDYGGRKRELRSEMLGRRPQAGARVIVSHIGTIYSVLPSITGQLEEGDCVVVRPEGGTRYHVIEVVPWRTWVQAAGEAP
jgi:broad specificity phosphatase PhoE